MIKKHTEKGRHHIRPDEKSKKGFGHIELVQYFITQYPHTRDIMQACLAFSLDDLKRELVELTHFHLPVLFTPRRADFIFNLIQYRKDRLQEVLIQ